MRIEIDIDDQGGPHVTTATSVTATDGGEPRITGEAPPASPEAEDAGPPAVSMDHPLAPPAGAPAAPDVAASLDGGAAPRFD
ncbi:hypothetical protein J5X84_30475 [Streptosporangiaceae bacterium NEAU-GS5]|nr:hypothetical protein [Streptosporangiaceae bacterium NEAU-GS5]